MPKMVHIAVSFPLPEGATVADAMAYVGDAVRSHCGSLRPPGADGDLNDLGDPMWGVDEVEIKNLRRILAHKRREPN